MNLQPLNKITLEEGEYYLVQNFEWSPSGYAIAECENGYLICESCDRTIPFENITGIIKLEEPNN